MIYTEETVKAMRLCYEAHHGQTDKAGVPYVFHPFHLAEQMTDEDSAVAALKGNPIARAVKLADLAHNSDPTRLPQELRNPEREERYRRAMELLLR